MLNIHLILISSGKTNKNLFHFRYVFWYHNDRMVNYDTERGISVFTSSGGDGKSSGSQPAASTPAGGGGGKTKSQFVIAEATPTDSGNYTCKPSNAVPASIQVFVSNTRGKISVLLLLVAFSCCFFTSLSFILLS